MRKTLKELHDQVSAIQADIEYEVTATPSGDKRNLLTDVNIHLMIATAALAEVQALK